MGKRSYDLPGIIREAIGNMMCLFGRHKQSKITYCFETIRKRKTIDATEVKEYYVCDRCGTMLGPTGRAGTMYELFGHTRE